MTTNKKGHTMNDKLFTALIIFLSLGLYFVFYKSIMLVKREAWVFQNRKKRMPEANRLLWKLAYSK